jgi:hypothetical protein
MGHRRLGQPTPVTRGLDPRVYLYFQITFQKTMDCRVKPGNDVVT